MTYQPEFDTKISRQEARLLELAADMIKDRWRWKALANDFSVSQATMQPVQGAFTTVLDGTCIFEALLPFQTAATTTGIGVALDVPDDAQVWGLAQHATSATATGGSEQVADAASTGATTGVRAANAATLLVARWLLIAPTPGLVRLMVRSEVAGSAVTLKAGGLIGYRVI